MQDVLHLLSFFGLNNCSTIFSRVKWWGNREFNYNFFFRFESKKVFDSKHRSWKIIWKSIRNHRALRGRNQSSTKTIKRFLKIEENKNQIKNRNENIFFKTLNETFENFADPSAQMLTLRLLSNRSLKQP